MKQVVQTNYAEGAEMKKQMHQKSPQNSQKPTTSAEMAQKRFSCL